MYLNWGKLKLPRTILPIQKKVGRNFLETVKELYVDENGINK